MKRARGVALITALLVVALATLAAAAVLSQANASLHRTAGLQDSEQAWWYARGVESWILGILAEDSKKSGDHDGFDEAWATPVDYLPVDEGFVKGQIVDLQGQFNLNNLAPSLNPNDGHHALRELYGRQFQRMVEMCDCLETGVTAGSVVKAVRDWMTPAQGQGGSASEAAKDSYYLGLTPPYRAGLRKFSSPSELLAVQGVTPKLYRSLRRFVTALPDKSPTPINVNTAPAEVLHAACDSIDEGKLEQWIKRVQKQPVADAAAGSGNASQAFITDTACQLNGFGAKAANQAAQVFSGKTQYFQIRGDVFVGSGRLALYSLVYRPDTGGTPVVIARDVD